MSGHKIKQQRYFLRWGRKNYSGIRYYWFALRWLCKHSDWANTRQKFKAMNKEWEDKG